MFEENPPVTNGDTTPRAHNVTMNDVAALAGVSLKTVSNVVNNYPHIRPTTRSRVEDAIKTLGYQINLTARSLRRGRTGLVGLVIPDLLSPYFSELAQALTVQAEGRGLSVIIELTGGTKRGELAALSDPRRGLTDGIFFSPAQMTAKDKLSLEVDYPIVLLGEQIFDGPTDHVVMDNVAASRTATEHLIESGARRILLLGYESGESALNVGALRSQGYFQALDAAGLSVDPDLLIPTREWNRWGGAAAVEDALERGIQFDAIFGVVDVVAIGAMHALHSHGISIPEEVQVIGFDDIDESSFTSPPLTTIDPGMHSIAHEAFERLVRQMEVGHRLPPSTFYAPFTLKKRGTTRG